MDKRLENLTPFKSGHKSTGGRPKGSKTISILLEKLLEKKLMAKDPFSGKEKKMPASEIIAIKLIASAIKGNIHAQKEIMDRLEGRAVQKQIISTPDGAPIQVNLSSEEIAKTEAKLEDEY